MTIETTLYSTLSVNAGVSAYTSTRIYPNQAPESTALPYISYFVVSGERIDTIPGTGNAVRKRIQINCHAGTYSAAKALASAVETALAGDGYLELEYDLYDSQAQVHTCIIDWSFMSV